MNVRSVSKFNSNSISRFSFFGLSELWKTKQSSKTKMWYGYCFFMWLNLSRAYILFVWRHNKSIYISWIRMDVMCFMCVYANHTTVSKNKKEKFIRDHAYFFKVFLLLHYLIFVVSLEMIVFFFGFYRQKHKYK